MPEYLSRRIGEHLVLETPDLDHPSWNILEGVDHGMNVREDQWNTLVVERSQIPNEMAIAPEMAVELVFKRPQVVRHPQHIAHARREAHLRERGEGIRARGDEFVERNDEARVPIDGRNLVKAGTWNKGAIRGLGRRLSAVHSSEKNGHGNKGGFVEI